LPRDSAFVRTAAPEVANWGNTEELLAAVVEAVDYGNRLFVSAHTKKGSHQPKPVQIRRPGAPPEPKRRQATGEDMRRFFATTGA
jgi:hypothetical protein